MVICLKQTVSVGFKSAALIATGLTLLLTTSNGADPDAPTSDSKLIEIPSQFAVPQPPVELASPVDAATSMSRPAGAAGDCRGCAHNRGEFSDRGSYYRDGGVPLHSSGCHGDCGGHSGGGYYGGSRTAGNTAVDYYSGVPGMRITEWPSTTTGLTLSEEQNVRLNSGVVVPYSLHQPSGCPLPLKKPYFNIPDYVW